jgi:hypothetical protein
MIRSLTAGVTLALCGLVCGCLVSLQPLSSAAQATVDEQLLGVWRAHDPGEDLVYLHIGRGDKRMTEATMVEHRDDGTYKAFRYTAFPTKAEGMTLLNVMSPEDHKDTKGYDIVRYQIDGKTLSIALLSEDAVKQAITGGKLKGRIESGTLGDTTITASGPELLAYIKASDPAKLFPKTLRFERAAGR